MTKKERLEQERARKLAAQPATSERDREIAALLEQGRQAMERSTAHYIALGRKFWTVDDLHEPGDGLKKKTKQPPTKPLQNFTVGEDESLSEASVRLAQETAEQRIPSGAAPAPTKPPEDTKSSFAEWRDSVIQGKKLTRPTAEILSGYEDQPMRWTRPY